LSRQALLTVNSVTEWDDRTSPDGYEEYLLIKPMELKGVLEQFADQLNNARSTLKGDAP
jgi:hypothetical protein